MSRTRVKLQISFDLELSVPEKLRGLDHQALCKVFHALLGMTVIQAVPKVIGKQLTKAGIELVGHHHHLNASHSDQAPIDRALLIAIAPHLDDAELGRLSHTLAGAHSTSSGDLPKLIRRKALAIANDYRLVECRVEAILTSGAQVELDATLNLTNGNILVADKDRQHRLKSDQGALKVRIARLDTALNAQLGGQTLSGPVLTVEVGELAKHRDVLIARWQGL